MNKALIDRTKKLNTIETLINDFTCLGIHPGMTVIVHSSLSSIGWVCGGEVAVIQALMEIVTEEGTIIMPTQSTENTDPKYWQYPPIPEEWWNDVRQYMPAYDPATTPTLGMGKIPETFRKFPGVLRSNHPTSSFAAWGKHAAYITENHSLDYPFGEQSPLAKIYSLDGSILFIGVDYDSCTSMHLSEFRANGHVEYKQSSAIFENGKRVWKTFTDIEEDSENFPKIGKAFEKDHSVQTGHVGQAACKLIHQRELVDFTVDYLNDH
ncbi:aminoglycoside 3-N-acetyltransferase [Oikeobacillus pervagus]|uniref:Aminoglycoside N(3)-acetyltransferase n=1 Tax=Oikeobacillus pervagus TaxID=1325931 RepID=A0AAJ1T2B7_9BACI|nr:AAC(3) family N-acetyltransferase [Oikeobacillus pervagus]MDQ0215892.1 aminoglycoside 3-N-acetyltransferase [Oikeobacillus pervagus]